MAGMALLKDLVKQALRPNLPAYRAAREFYHSLFSPWRLVRLSGRRLHRPTLTDLEDDARYSEIVTDLVAFTGFPRAKLQPYLLREPEKSHESEFCWFSPRNDAELSWFYRCSSAYLFANAVHPYATVLDTIQSGTVLDYGAGAGCNTIGLAKRNVEVHFIEINRIQADFIRFRAERRGLGNVREIPPYHAGRFDPVSCITGRYDAIVAMDVLEHIPAYHHVVRRFVEALKPGGLIFERSPFDPYAGDVAIHLAHSMPLDEAMVGMQRIGKGLWQKK
jgi:hypothetical protein